MTHHFPPRSARLAALAWLIFTFSAHAQAPQAPVPAVGQFQLRFDKAGVTSLRFTGDKFDTDYMADEATLGHVRVRYRMGESEWRQFSTDDPKNKVQPLPGLRSRRALQQLNVVYNPQQWIRNEYYADLELTTRFRAEADALYWTIFLRNPTHKPLELGDLFLPLPFNTSKRWDKTISYEQRLVQHQYISGHGSFLYWMRPNGAGPYLVMTPLATCPLFEPTRSEMNFAPAKLEYAERGGVYILSGRRGEEDRARGGAWRQPQTTHTLTPTNSQRDGLTFAFKFRWAKNLDAVRDLLVEEGLLDVQVVPGMTLPVGTEATVAIRTRSILHAFEPEFAASTTVQPVEPAQKQKDTRLYRVKFTRLGENKITVRFGKNQYAVLEFFVTEPIATLIRKRAAFLAARQQHRDPAKWYNGLFSEWDMRQKVLRGPDDTGGLARYILASDDPALSKPVFLAAKNALYPDPREIAALEYYLENFVWGKLQMTREEKYPYGMYGIDNWKVNRESQPEDRDGWVDHLWRAYDYPHFVYFYWSMYQIAKHHPERARYANKEEYLERAYGTARAFYTYPWQFARWPAHEVGNYNKMVIPVLMAELERVGWTEKAAELRRHWEEKVEYFINEQPDLFYSEYPFDPTAFESTGAFAHYAQEQSRNAQRTLKVTASGAQRFMAEQLTGNIATRGWLEPNYWQLGVEGNMRYMSQMGGWSILDYALHHTPEPWPYLRLGYASLLSSWALMNTGTPETNFGYWYPGPENDGAAGSAFVPAAFGSNWFGKQQPRGAWQYSGEIDLGFAAALRSTAVVVADDPLFGRIAYGGALTRSVNETRVVPQDGVGRRLHLLIGKFRVSLALDRDGFASADPIRFDDDLQRITFVIENRDPGATSHSIELTVSGLPTTYEVAANGKPVGKLSSPGGVVALPIAEQTTTVTLTRQSVATTFTVVIRLDATAPKGPLKPIWRFFGADEPNYAYMKDGKKLLAALGQLQPRSVHPELAEGERRVYFRTHNLLSSGDGTPALKWGSTGAYREDANGNPIYDWTILDRIFDTYLERGVRPYVQIGFMPKDLSTKPEPYQHSWKPGDNYGDIYTGWAYPPDDYAQWGELAFQWTNHAIERYGRREVETWYWEVWNEPNIGYWRGTPQEFHKLHDYAVHAVRRALPTAKVGGPDTAGSGRFLREFLEHCLRGANYATGQTGTPLDFIAFHAKGAPRYVDGHVRMGIANHLRAVEEGFRIIASFPELKSKPVIIGESDPDGCAACSAHAYPQYAYRNDTLYASYTAASFARKLDLAEKHGVNLEGALTWAFEFEDQPYFAGFRALSTNGIVLPVLNVFRMFSKMGGQRLAVESGQAVPLETMLREGVRDRPDVSALASLDEKKLSILVWHYHDDDVPGPAAAVELTLTNLPLRAGQARLQHFRIDDQHSNAFTAWKEMGAPQQPTPEQYAQLERASHLTALDAPRTAAPSTLRVQDSTATLSFHLPRQAVSLIVLTWQPLTGC